MVPRTGAAATDGRRSGPPSRRPLAGRDSQDRLLDSAPDMGALAAVERFLERLFERQSARLFRTGLRPIQVQRRIERAMEAHRVRDGGRTIVPHRFVVRLTADDLAALRAATPGLAAEPRRRRPRLRPGPRLHPARPADASPSGADPAVEVGEIAVDAADPTRPRRPPAIRRAAPGRPRPPRPRRGRRPDDRTTPVRRPPSPPRRRHRRRRPGERPRSSSCPAPKARGRRSARSGPIAPAGRSTSRAGR